MSLKSVISSFYQPLVDCVLEGEKISTLVLLEGVRHLFCVLMHALCLLAHEQVAFFLCSEWLGSLDVELLGRPGY